MYAKEEIKAEVENGSIGGKYCKDCTGQLYYIVGVTMTNEDFYWVGINSNREIHFLSYVGTMTPVENGNDDFSFLNYLIKFEPLTIVNDVNRYIKSLKKDVLISKINIDGKLY